jgi:hypothetical protein
MPAGRVELLDPQQEIDVLQSILLRETYLIRLQQLVARLKSKGDDAVRRARSERREEEILISLPSELVDLLDLLRTSTLDAVEAIQR